MGSFFSLFRGETKKIWSKKSAWVMIVILSGIMALMALLFGAMGSLGEDVVRSFNQSSLVGQLNSLTGMEITGDLYLEQAEENLPALKEQVEQAREEMEASTGIERYANFIAYNSMKREYQVMAYQVEHQIAPERMAASWGYIQLAEQLAISIIILLVLIIGAGSVASEYADGTIKLLFPRPYRRWKILLAKFLATLGYGIVLLVIGYALSLLSGGILYGFENAGTVVVRTNGIAAYQTTAFGQSVIFYLTGVVGILLTLVMAVMISCLFRSRAAAVGVTLLIYLVSGTVTGLLAMFGAEWVKYTVFFNMDLSVYLQRGAMVPGMNIVFSGVAMGLYTIVFLVIAFLSFCKRDV